MLNQNENWKIPLNFSYEHLRLRLSHECYQSFNLLLLAELVTTVTVALQLSGRDDNKINVFTSSSNVICTDVNCAIIVLNSLIWLVIELPSPIFRLTSLWIKYTLLVADGFSYIFDNAFIKSTIVFSFMMLNATFLANVNCKTREN